MAFRSPRSVRMQSRGKRRRWSSSSWKPKPNPKPKLWASAGAGAVGMAARANRIAAARIVFFGVIFLLPKKKVPAPAGPGRGAVEGRTLPREPLEPELELKPESGAAAAARALDVGHPAGAAVDTHAVVAP